MATIQLQQAAKPALLFPCLELIAGRAVAPSTTLTQLTAYDASFQIAANDGQTYLIQAWNKNQTKGTLQIRHERMHDKTNGFSIPALTGAPQPALAFGEMIPFRSLDLPILEISGSGTSGDHEIGCGLYFYTNRSGIKQNLITRKDLYAFGDKILTLRHTITGAAGGHADAAFNVSGAVNNMEANTWYAVVGYMVDTDCAAVTYKSPDLGNIRLGGPGNSSLKDLTRDWFIRISDEYGIPAIPVVNSGNNGLNFVGTVTDENGGTLIVTTILRRMKPEFARIAK